MYLSCPACFDDGYVSPKSYWTHTACGQGKLHLTENAHIFCDYCWHQSHVSNWSFKCNNNRHDFRIPSTSAFIEAVTSAGQFGNRNGTQWLVRFLQQLG